ncbi:hypothetical protein [Georgenia wangjunii]|uniref:hypothetical protein n=1 Tax=Georgenia wangjunii TaxID=3117730 RepID=UPI002F260F76
MSTHDDARPDVGATTPTDAPETTAGPVPTSGDQPTSAAAPAHTAAPAEGDAATAPAPAAAPAEDRTLIDPATLRRAPRYGRFAFVGVLLGALASLVLALLPGGGSDLGTGTLFLLLFIALGSLGALLGALAAVLAERRSVRRRPARDALRP